MKAFMTQDEKLVNKSLLEEWTLKAQLKSFMLAKQTIFSKMDRSSQYSQCVQELVKEVDDTVRAVQLNQRKMQAMVLINELVAEFL